MQLAIAVIAFVVLAALFAIRAMGGGDVKLLTALALWVPSREFLELLLIMAVVGGILTILFGCWHVMRHRKDRLAIPYGVAIAIAGLSVLYLNHFQAAFAAGRGLG
jgi:prepilin peptidase CpaA